MPRFLRVHQTHSTIFSSTFEKKKSIKIPFHSNRIHNLTCATENKLECARTWCLAADKESGKTSVATKLFWCIFVVGGDILCVGDTFQGRGSKHVAPNLSSLPFFVHTVRVYNASKISMMKPPLESEEKWS